MTRKEAQKFLIEKIVPCVSGKWLEAVNVAIEALEQPEPCEDCISRAAAIEKVMNNLTYLHTFGAERVGVLLKELPSVTPKRKAGTWLIEFVKSSVVCNQCGHETLWSERSNFCPECGAEMREADHEP